MGRQVEWHVVEEHREIRAVIKIETAQKILVRLPTASVLRDDDTGHSFKDFPTAQNWAVGKLRRAGGALRGRIRDAKQAVLPSRHDHIRQACDVGRPG